MAFSDFWLSIFASFISSVIFALAAKITLERWKQWAIGFGTTVLIAVCAGTVIFAGIMATKSVSAYFARSSLQEKITAYTKGHYPSEIKRGYAVEVLEVGERVFLSLKYPEIEAYPAPHPLSNPLFASEITRLLNDNGFPGSPIWGYQMKPLNAEQMEKFLRRE